MGQPEKDPEINPNKANPGEIIPPVDEKLPPKLDAILPDDLPPSAAELVDDIDSYQRRMEKEWESVKSSYEEKINRIMREFTVADQPPSPSAPPPERPKRNRLKEEDRLKNLMGELEVELRRAGQIKPHFAFEPSPKKESLQLGWEGSARHPWKKFAIGAALTAMLLAGFAVIHSRAIQVTALPYTKTLGPIVAKNNVYILDWFRRSLYIHKNDSDLTIRAVEPLANNLATGLALSDKTVWSIDALDRKILIHAVTPDHLVTSSIDAPGTKPVGLFFDGLDLWSADQDSKKLYRHRGNDIEDIRDTFPLPDIHTTAFTFHNNRLWLLDGKSRLINVYRLQKPMLQLGSFDLDPFVKNAAPTGFTIVGKKIWVVTENPPQLLKIPLSRLKKSKTEAF